MSAPARDERCARCGYRWPGDKDLRTAIVYDPGPPSDRTTGGMHIMVRWVPTMSLGPYCTSCVGHVLTERNAGRPS